jgi:hypothetical protein
LVHIQATAVTRSLSRLGVLGLALFGAVFASGCDKGTGLLVENRTSSDVLIRVQQSESGPLVFNAPPDVLAWALHPIDLTQPAGPIELLDQQCRILGSWTESGYLVINQDGAQMKQLPLPEQRPLASVRLASSNECGGPLSP